MKHFVVSCFVLLAVLATAAQADFILWNDEQLTVDSSHQEGNLYDTSRAFIVSGGDVDDLYAHDSSTVDMSNGSASFLRAYESSTVDLSGGQVGLLYAHDFSTVDILDGAVSVVRAYTSSTVDISDGSVSSFYADNSSTVNMSGGAVNSLSASDVGIVNMSGGSVSYLSATDSSTLSISGGLIDNNLRAYSSSVVTFNVRDFRLGAGLTLDGERLLGTGILSGEWVDELRWEVNVATNSGAGIFVSLVGTGDTNCDGVVDEADAAILATNWLTSTEATWRQGDFNGDYAVDDIDATMLAANWTGPLATVPEPGSITLLVCGALGLLAYVCRRRRERGRCFACAAAVAALLIAGSAQADVFNMGGTRNPDGSWTGLASLETVSVGNPGNAGELSGASAGGYGHDAIVGSVSYTYNIGKYEVTCGQYTEFLNAVAKTDTYGLYNTFMSFSSTCIIERSGTSGSLTYSVAADRANRPVSFVSWGDAARFCNWLSNGQPTGAQGTATTEDGSYYLNGDTALMSVTRKPEATWVIPTEDEWYKAAYYDPNKGGAGVAGYWDYPTKSDTPPINTLLTPDPGNHANFQDHFGTGNRSNTLGYPYYTTLVGDFENSASPYGTFDQGGNVSEWNETAISGARGRRGGQWMAWSVELQSSYRFNTPPTYISGNTGFRVASVPDPIPGDANNDGVVDDKDASILATNWQTSTDATWRQGDFNGDGAVNDIDATLLAANWQQNADEVTATVPEPGTITLLLCGLASLALLRRR